MITTTNSKSAAQSQVSHVYERGSPHETEFLLDLLHSKTDKPRCVPYEPAMIAEGLGGNAPTARLLNISPLPAGISEISIPRVSAGTGTVVQEKEQNPDTANVFEVKAYCLIPIMDIERPMKVDGRSVPASLMCPALVQDMLVDEWFHLLNHLVLFGNGNSGGSGVIEPEGLLLQTDATAGRFQNCSPSNRVSSPDVLLSKIETEVAEFLGRRRNGCATDYCVIMSPHTWCDLQRASKSDGSPLLVERQQTGQNLSGKGSVLNGLSVGESAGTLFGLDVVVDPQIPDTFTADGTPTGGDQRRIVLMHRSDVPLFVDKQFCFRYEKQLDSDHMRLTVSGWAAFTASWKPESVSVIYGTGTKIGRY